MLHFRDGAPFQGPCLRCSILGTVLAVLHYRDRDGGFHYFRDHAGVAPLAYTLLSPHTTLCSRSLVPFYKPSIYMNMERTVLDVQSDVELL